MHKVTTFGSPSYVFVLISHTQRTLPHSRVRPGTGSFPSAPRRRRYRAMHLWFRLRTIRVMLLRDAAASPSLAASPSSAPRCRAARRRCAALRFLSVSPSRWIFTLSPFARGTLRKGDSTLSSSLAATSLGGHARARLEVGRLVRQTTPRNLAFFQILPAA